MLLYFLPKDVQPVVGLATSSLICGWFLNTAIMVFDKQYASVTHQFFTFGLYLAMAAMVGYVAVETAQKLLKLIRSVPAARKP